MENIHTEKSRWLCPVCNLYFRVRADLYHHRTSHHKGKSNIKIEKSCPYCQRLLTTETAYKVHTKSCKNNPSRMPRPNKFTWTDEMRERMSETMKNAHKEGRAFSWADLSKRKEHSWPEKWLIEVLKNECNLVEGIDYETEVKFHTFSLDFVFPNKKVIEMDGSQHKVSEYQKDCDKRKDALLQEEGWSELRVDWDYCYTNSKDAIKRIIEFLG